MKLIASRVGIPAEPAEAASLAPRQLECQGWLWQAADCQPGYLATWNISQHTRQLDTALNSRDVCLKFAQVEVALEKCTPASYLFANSEMSAAGSRSVEKSPAVSWHLPQVVSQLVNKVLIRQLLEIATNWHGNAGMMIIFHSLSLSKLQQLILRLAKNDMTIWYVQSACC